jgi:hypothetical protein
MKEALEDLDEEDPLAVLSIEDIESMQGDCLTLLW